MFNPIPINLAVEGVLDEAVLRKLLKESEKTYVVGHCYHKNGFGYLKSNIKGFNNGAKGTPFLVLTDLDTIECAPSLIKKWLNVPQHKNLIFRVAVRDVESWLLAHRSAFADFLGISVDRIPNYPDNLDRPKVELINLAKSSRNREIRKAIVPQERSTAKIGPDYNSALARFVVKNWDAVEASKNSPSLERTLNAINSFRPAYK